MTNNNWKGQLLDICESIPKEAYPNMFYSKIANLIENIIDEANKKNIEIIQLIKKQIIESNGYSICSEHQTWNEMCSLCGTAQISKEDAVFIIDKNISDCPKFSKSGLDVFNEKINTEIKEVNIAKIIKNNQNIFPVVYWSSLTNILRDYDKLKDQEHKAELEKVREVFWEIYNKNSDYYSESIEKGEMDNSNESAYTTAVLNQIIKGLRDNGIELEKYEIQKDKE